MFFDSEVEIYYDLLKNDQILLQWRDSLTRDRYCALIRTVSRAHSLEKPAYTARWHVIERAFIGINYQNCIDSELNFRKVNTGLPSLSVCDD